MADIKLDIENLKDIKVYGLFYGATLPMAGLEANAAAARLGFSNILLSIELTEKTEFFQWITTKKKVNGTIKIGDAKNQGADLRKITFEDAYITSLSESFTSGGNGGGLSISIAFTKIDMNGVKYDVKAGK